ncbi:mucin-6 [Tupaia chinensis]|uniref:mucin-6 n=1 Tax=Tupaia chinensis TaxID=246437 RepID=UPI000FFB85E1|nr:mucin-6 [Tupaia chinensis]
MLRPWLLLLLCHGGALLGAGLDDTPFANPGLQRPKDSPQTDSEDEADGARDPTDDKGGLHSSPDKGWCATWGAGHFSTFDQHLYDFSGTCNYIFAAACKDASPTFSVQLRRGPGGNISRVIVELGASVVTVNEATISIRDIGVVHLPYTSNGLQITPFGQSVRLVARQLELELVVIWGPDAHLMVLVERKYMGQMCGLCGNFDGKTTNEFLSEDGKLLEPHKYAALQKLDDPNEICAYEAIPSPLILQVQHARICTHLLALVSSECTVPKEPFVLSCQADMATCAQPGRPSCSCATLSEYSRQCSMAGQPASRWRGPGLCPLDACPANQVYQECGAPCARTCSNPQHSCSGFCTFGCFCPEGMVLNDLSRNRSCVPVTQCPCMLNGAVYAPGEVTTAACRTCQCVMGRWTCTELPCPGHCSLEGSSFVTTFDSRPYRFHGTCSYILLQSSQLPNEGTLMAVYDKSGYSHSETSLVSVIYLSKQDKIVISQDEIITNHGDAKRLPYQTRNITVFRQTSTHLQMATSFGLEVVIQVQPIFQVYITVGPQFRGQTRGLCGNFNGDTTDDFTTSVGMAEGTASLFVDSWRAGNCPAALERETDPCSMSQLNKVCAETHCSVLLKEGTVFETCHAVVNPKPFYKRCVYEACNYEETFPHICAALGDYAHACASRGMLLRGWRSSVDNCTIPCTGNRTFSYDSQACDRTCLSLSDREAECHRSAVPVDGCNCPEGTYLNHKAECVRRSQCPCLLEGHKPIPAEQSAVVNGVICYCTNGRLSCPGQQQRLLDSCPAPKTFQSCSQSSENKFGAACAPTCQMLATGVTCVPTKCEPGCVCADGLYENANGQCVPPEECPCEFAGVSYSGGAELHTDCSTCTCSRGKWTCQESASCPSTCVLYGEGHMITFDGQRFVFDGNCEYILATDGCGANDSQSTFKILTENVVCGKSGVTCSRAIRISLGGLSIELADRNCTVSGEDPHVFLRVKPSSLNLVLDMGIPGRYNLTLIWNKHMTVFIKIHRASQDALCGLCGNYNGNMKDDFETRSKYVASDELEFVNSWKESPLCGDVSFVVDPCSLNAFRRSWAERKCSIINSQTFAACHTKVYHLPYYEACVRDTCGCDSGGDCECLCDAVAAYAKACLDKGVCVDWRAPDFCPIYCDFYNTHARLGSGDYQYTQEANCTWHYQPCLCPGRPQSLPDVNIEGCYNCSQDEYFDHDKGTCVPCALSLCTWHYQPCLCPGRPQSLPDVNIEGCYNCSQDEYFDHDKGTCVPCGPPPTPPPPTTGSPPTPAQPTTVTLNTTGLLSSPHTPVGSTGTPALPATSTAGPSASSSVQTGTASTMQAEPTVSGESPRTTAAITPWATSALAPTTTPRSTPIGLTMTQATTQTTASSLSSSTKSTAQSTSRTTEAQPTLATSETAPSSAPSHQGTPGTTSSQETQHTQSRPTPANTTGQTEQTTLPTGSPGTPTMSTLTPKTATSLRTPYTPTTTHSPPTLSVSATPHTMGPSSGTSFNTPTTGTPPGPHSTPPIPIPTLATSSGTPTTPRVITPTQHHTPSTSASKPTGTVLLTTTVQGTGPTNSVPPLTSTTRGTSHTHSPFSTASTSASPGPETPHYESTSAFTTITPTSTNTGTGTPVAHTSSATTGSPHTPSTTHSSTTLSVSAMTHTTGSHTGTPFKTTTILPSPSGPHTTLPTRVPTFSTSSVTPSTHRVITPTNQQTFSSSTHKPTGTILPTTSVQGTGPTHSAPPLTSTTSGTSHAHSSFSTARTSTSSVSNTHHESTTASATTITPKPTSRGTGTPGVYTSTTPKGSHTPFTTHQQSTLSVLSTPHTTGTPSRTSFKTTTILPSPSGPHTTFSTLSPTFSTSSVTPTTHRAITPTHQQTLSTSSLKTTGSILPTTSVQSTGPTHSVPPLTSTTSGTSHAPSPFSTTRTSTFPVSKTTHHASTSISATTITPRSTSRETGTTVVHTSSPHTPFTTHSSTTLSISATPHTTGTPSEISFKTTSINPSPSGPHTTLSTLVPTFSTSSVTPSTHRVITPTPQQTFSSATPKPTSIILPTTSVQGTGPTHSVPPLTSTTGGTSHAHSSFSTAKTSTSLVSQPSPTANRHFYSNYFNPRNKCPTLILSKHRHNKGDQYSQNLHFPSVAHTTPQIHINTYFYHHSQNDKWRLYSPNHFCSRNRTHILSSTTDEHHEGDEPFHQPIQHGQHLYIHRA